MQESNEHLNVIQRNDSTQYIQQQQQPFHLQQFNQQNPSFHQSQYQLPQSQQYQNMQYPPNTFPMDFSYQNNHFNPEMFQQYNMYPSQQSQNFNPMQIPFEQQPQPFIQDPSNNFSNKTVFPSTRNRLSPDEVIEIQNILVCLDGSKDSIKYAKKQLLDHKHACKQISKALMEAMLAIDHPHFPKKLQILYLINDVLHDCMAQREKKENLDKMTLSLLFFLGDMLRHSYQRHDEVEQQAKVDKLLQLQESRNIFDSVTIEDLRVRMKQEPPDDHITSKQTLPMPAPLPTSTLHLTPGYLADFILKKRTESQKSLNENNPNFNYYSVMDSKELPARQEAIQTPPNSSNIDQKCRQGLLDLYEKLKIIDSKTFGDDCIQVSNLLSC